LKVLRIYFAIWRNLCGLLRRHNAEKLRENFMHARCGSLKPTDALILARILFRNKPRNILEVGSFLGLSTRFLLDVSSKWDAVVTAVDPNIPHRVFDNPKDLLELLNARYLNNRLEIVTAYFGNPSSCMTGQIPIVNSGLGSAYDLIFIDGDHSYESVIDNFNLSLKMLAQGGCIVFHDALSWDGVEKALEDIAIEFRGKATVEILGKGDRRLLRLIGRSNDGIGIFRFTAAHGVIGDGV
jgi:predicted O-methyltransferase YrrM